MKMRGPKKAIVRSQNGEAQSRVDWKRKGWPDAKFEGTSAKWDLRNGQQRENREDSRERREKREQRQDTREKAMVRSQTGGVVEQIVLF